MAHVFVSYRLKKGVTREEFETWSRTVDVPAIRSTPSVKSIAVYRVDRRLLAFAPPTAQYIEVLDVPDLPGFLTNDVPGPALKAVLEQFGAYTDNLEIVSATPL